MTVENSYSCTGSDIGRVITFYGADNQPGVTMVSKSVAEMLEKEGYNVLFLSADRNGCCDYSNVQFQAYLEDVAALMTGKEGDREKTAFLCSQIVSDGITDMLPGVRNDFGRRYFDEKFLVDVCRIMRRIYDFIVIDGGTGYAEGLGKASIEVCEMIYIVTTQQEKSFRRLNPILPAIKEYYREGEDKIRYIFNKFNGSPVFCSLKEAAEVYGCENDGFMKIEYVPFGWQAEKEMKTLIWNRWFAKGIKKITSDILKGCRNEYES